MPKRCCVPMCKSGFGEGYDKIKMFRMPKDREKFKIWEEKIGCQDRQLKATDLVCELHFEADMIQPWFVHKINGEEIKIPRDNVRLIPEAAPSKFPVNAERTRHDSGVMICKTCIDFKNERDYYYRKCKDYEWKLAEYEVKNAEERRKLQESQKEIKQLKELISRFDKEDVSNILPSENYTETQLIVPKLEPPDVDDSEQCSQLTCEMEIKMEPEVVLEEGVIDKVNQSECDVESDESDPPEPNSPERKKRSKQIELNCGKYLCTAEQKFYQICRWTLRTADGSFHVCKKMFNVSDLTNHIAQAHAGPLQTTCSWENCPTSDKPFRTTADLLEHVHCHLFQAKYRCSVPDCGQPFFLEHHLKKHMVTHMAVTEPAAEHPYTCPYSGCGVVTSSANYLRRHMVVHVPVQTANMLIQKFST